MGDYFFQIFLFLAGAFVGITVPLLPKPRQKQVAGFLALALITVAVLWAGYELNSKPAVIPVATNASPAMDTPPATVENMTTPSTTLTTDTTQPPIIHVTATPNADPTLYDDFNSPGFDGAFNQSLWRYWDKTNSVGFTQKDGVLQFVGHKSTGLIARKHVDLLIRASTFYEAKLRLRNAAAGSVVLRLHGSLPGGNWWATQCGIYARAANGSGWAFCDYGAKNNSLAYTNGEDVDLGTWHTFRLEVDPAQKTVTYYIDGESRGNILIPDFDAARFSLVVATDTTSGTTTANIDDIRYGPMD